LGQGRPSPERGPSKKKTKRGGGGKWGELGPNGQVGPMPWAYLKKAMKFVMKGECLVKFNIALIHPD